MFHWDLQNITKKILYCNSDWKVCSSYTIVFVSHYLGLSLVEPFLENIDDAVTPVYIGIIIFGVMMTGCCFTFEIRLAKDFGVSLLGLLMKTIKTRCLF